MFEEEIIVIILVSLFALCLHYYIGTIDLWYLPAVEIFIGIIFYELTKAMYKSYKTYDNHKKVEQKAREAEINLMTELNTVSNSYIPPKKSELKEDKNEDKNKKNITFDKNKEIRQFRNNEKILDDIEISVGKQEIMSDTTMSETDDIMSMEEKFTSDMKQNV